MQPSVGDIETDHDQRKNKIAHDDAKANVVFGHVAVRAKADDMADHAPEQESALRNDRGEPEVASDEETQEANETQGDIGHAHLVLKRASGRPTNHPGGFRSVEDM